MASLKEQFEEAALHFSNIHSTCSTKDKLRLYALWNQATNGDVDLKSQPSAAQIEKRAKFDARKKVMGLPKDTAMKRYISELRGIDPDWQVGVAEGVTTPSTPMDNSDARSTSSKGSRLSKLSPKNIAKSLTGKSSSNTESDFKRACDYAFKSKRFATTTSRVLLYSYYKQATEGPCRSAAPRFAFNRTKYSRWRAWANLFEMSKEEAMERYVDHVKKIAPEFQKGVPEEELFSGGETDEDEEEGAEDDRSRKSVQLAAGVDLNKKTLAEAIKSANSAKGLVYLLTGASGFLGTFLVGELLKRNRNSIILCVTRDSSINRFRQEMVRRYGVQEASRVLPIAGDISKPNLGLDKEVLKTVTDGKILDHFFHLAASYDMAASDKANEIANVEGTAHAVELANTLGKACGTVFQYTSSIVVAGKYQGMFLESMLEEGQEFDNPYARTKYEAEVHVRKRCTARYRVYRPGVVVGHSQTGEMLKIDGPYYFFKPIQQMRKYMPSALTLPCIEGSNMPLVPVDYVVAAMDAIAHISSQSLDKRAFHLVDSSPPSFLEVINCLAKAAGTAQFSSRLVTFFNALVPQRLWGALSDIPVLSASPGFIAKNVFGIPQSLVGYIMLECEWDDSDTRDVLGDMNLRCPRFSTYAWRLWDYYVRFMDKSLDKKKALRDAVSRKTIMVTGASDGIGLCLAKRLASQNAHVIIVARNPDKLAEVKKDIVSAGGNCSTYVADLSEEKSTNDMISKVIKDHGGVDILVNNAGRSIRRSVEYQYDRFHDFQRTIELNYYGSLRCILGFLPGMRKSGAGQVINISSIGCVTNAPRFGAYVASKAALDAFSRCVSTEVNQDGVVISTVYMGLVQTKMVVSKGNEYDKKDLLTVDQASEMIERCIVTKERAVYTEVGKWVKVGYFLFPSLVESIGNLTYRLEPEAAPHGKEDSVTAKGDKEQLKAIRQLFRGAF